MLHDCTLWYIIKIQNYARHTRCICNMQTFKSYNDQTFIFTFPFVLWPELERKKCWSWSRVCKAFRRITCQVFNGRILQVRQRRWSRWSKAFRVVVRSSFQRYIYHHIHLLFFPVEKYTYFLLIISSLLFYYHDSVVFIGSALLALQQLSGINAVFYFSSTVFKSAGVPSDIANMSVGVVNLSGYICHQVIPCSFLGIWWVFF